MKMIVRRTALAVCTLVLVLILPTAASAACTRFDDVPESADCYESVMYLAEHEITQGTGNGCFSPDAPVTTSQWAVMLCRGALYKSAFAAARIPVYDSVLYEGGVALSDYENCIRIGKELQICGEEDNANEIVTRGETAILLHAILTTTFTVEAPAAPVTLVNVSGVHVNDFLLELRKVPKPILDIFNAAGWTYCIDFDYMGELSDQLNMSCIGATNYSRKTIYISEANATLHEFGHFLDGQMGFPVEHERLYLAEAQNSGMRDYAKTNAREYFADCFDYYITHGSSPEMLERLRKNAPQTCAYFEELGKSGWNR